LPTWPACATAAALTELRYAIYRDFGAVHQGARRSGLALLVHSDAPAERSKIVQLCTRLNNHVQRLRPQASSRAACRPTCTAPEQAHTLTAAMRVALTIAGSDPSGGAGLQADLKTFTAFGVYGASVVTAVTVQDTRGVRATQPVQASLVADQLEAVMDDLAPAAAKTGMLPEAELVQVLVRCLRAQPLVRLVVDPVMVATSGVTLTSPAAIEVLRAELLPLAALVTPNLREAEVLTGRSVTDVAGMVDAARALVGLGARAALVTGGHLPGDAIDVLFDGRRIVELRAPRVAIARTHGTGCAVSAAIVAGLALGRDLEAAVRTAKAWMTRALEAAAPVGHGATPPNHLVALRRDY
jgi:hydroxymethylpyrimidine/phosphomethylpyrimidine kinase